MRTSERATPRARDCGSFANCIFFYPAFFRDEEKLKSNGRRRYKAMEPHGAVAI
jgi:hypothetical protein